MGDKYHRIDRIRQRLDWWWMTQPALMLPQGIVTTPPEPKEVAIGTARFTYEGKEIVLEEATADHWDDADGRHCIKLRGKVEGKQRAFLFTNVRLDAAKLTTGG